MSKANAHRNRKHCINLWLDENELAILDRLKELSCHRSRSATLRNLIAYGCVYNVEYKYLQDYTYEINQIGRRINQIAKRLNVTGNIYEEDVKQIKEDVDKLWHTHESMLSKAPLIDR